MKNKESENGKTPKTPEETVKKSTFLEVLLSSAMLTAVGYIAVGIVLIIWPEVSYETLCYVGAGIIAVIGVVNVVRYIVKGMSEARLNNYLSSGLILLCLAVFIVLHVGIFVEIIPLLLGLAILVDGIIKLQRAIDLFRLHYEGWVFVLILALMSLAMGIFLVLRPLDDTRNMVILLGIALVFCGVFSIVVTVIVSHRLNVYHQKEAITVEDIPAQQTGAVGTVPAPASSSGQETSASAAVSEPVRPSAAPAVSAPSAGQAVSQSSAKTESSGTAEAYSSPAEPVVTPAAEEEVKPLSGSWVNVTDVPFENVDLTSQADDNNKPSSDAKQDTANPSGKDPDQN